MGEDLTVNVALKDVNNYCYDTDNAEIVKIRIHGPFEDTDSSVYMTEPRTLVVDVTESAGRQFYPGKNA